MKNFLKGFIVGIGKIIPGVSGAMLAITMGIYDKSIHYISKFKENKKESIKYLSPILGGILIAIIIFSKIIELSLEKYYLITLLFFVGLIEGSIPELVKKIQKKNYIITFFSFVLFFLISITNIDNTYIIKENFLDIIVFFLSGIVEAIGTVVPGISSTALLMIMGTYNTVISSIGNITNTSILIDNIKIIIPFALGFAIGMLILVKIIESLFKKYSGKLYSFILGVLLSSIILLLVQAFKSEFKVIELIIGLLLLFIGIVISSIMKEK